MIRHNPVRRSSVMKKKDTDRVGNKRNKSSNRIKRDCQDRWPRISKSTLKYASFIKHSEFMASNVWFQWCTHNLKIYNLQPSKLDLLKLAKMFEI